jgi:exo-beta-1,3-glucanase (GH17 family)
MNGLSFSRCLPAVFIVAVTALIVGAWWWMGAAVQMPPSPLAAGEKLYCISYAPFRSSQNPLDPATRISAAQIDEDLSRLSQLTNCVRTYSIEHGLDQIPEIARRHGLKVFHGLWLSSDADKNRQEIATSIALATRYRDVITAIVVGNEVLLRGEISPSDLANIIRGVKAQVAVPVTYADVWEFWLRHRELYDAVDFITIHILPYWEDFPISAAQAAAHVEAIYRKVAAVFSAKDILIGEVGWPSAGRMRESALPSPVNQARVLHDVLALAKRDGLRVNVIEAFDQPWKRYLEGTVGGHWGLNDARQREAKFAWGEPLSNHPFWHWQAAGGVLFAALIFVVAGRTRGQPAPHASRWLGVAVNAIFGGILLGLTIEKVPIESLGLGGWFRSLALAAIAIAAPLASSAALMRGVPVPSFAQVLARSDERVKDRLALALGLILALLTLLALHVALGLDFDPRYRDFSYAPLTVAVVPYLVIAFRLSRPAGSRAVAEMAAAVTLGLSAIYITFNEGLANWQAIWLCATLLTLAVILFRARDAQG